VGIPFFYRMTHELQLLGTSRRLGRCMAGAGINSTWRRLHGGLVLIRVYEVFRSLHGLEIHWSGSQGSL
jgi:hypothetical protein